VRKYSRTLNISSMKKRALITAALFIAANITIITGHCIAQWVQSSSGLKITGYVSCMSYYSGYIFAGTYGGGIYKSTDNGNNWVCSSNGLEIENTLYNGSYIINNLFRDYNLIFAGTENGVYKSTDMGNTWAPANNGIYGGSVFSFYSYYPDIYAVTSFAIYKSTDFGTSWTGVSFVSLRNITYNGIYLFGGSSYNGMYRSSDGGSNWTSINSGLPQSTNRRLKALTAFAGDVYISLDTGYYPGGINSLGIYKTTNNGNSWGAANTGLTDKRVRSYTSSGSNIFAGTLTGVFISSNNGTLWTPVKNGLDTSVYSMVSSGGNIYAGSYGMYFTSNYGNNWNEINNGLNFINVNDICSSGNTLFCNSRLPYRTDNNGSNWILSSNGINSGTNCLYQSGNLLFAGSYYGGGVYKSSDNGMNWTQSSAGLPDSAVVNALHYHNGYLFSGIDTRDSNKGVFRSSNMGLTWEQTALNSFKVTSFASFGPKLFAGSPNNGLLVSTNNGTHWAIRLSVEVSSIAIYNNIVFAGTTSSGMLMSPDSGFTWTPVSPGPSNQNINTLFSYGNNLLAGTSGGVFVSTNNGTNWTSKNEGFQYLNVKKMFLKNNFIYAATDANGIYKRPKSEVISVQNISGFIPQDFKLYQNYPNPFNPGTTIKFDIQNSTPPSPLSRAYRDKLRGTTFVTLEIFDVTGKEVSVLVNEQLQPGSYTVDWNAATYPSGVYFYTLKSGNYFSTKKMILIK
jgi:photosystem II stability/assembly factor-like uncharacterized protein